MKSRFSIFLFSLFSISLLLAGCNSKPVGGYIGSSEEKDNLIKYAKLLRIYQLKDSTYKVQILDGNTQNVKQTLIISSSTTISGKHKEQSQIRLTQPCERMIIFSDVYGNALDELNASSFIVGAADVQYISTKSIKEKIERNSICDIGNSTMPSIEKMMSLNSDAVLISDFSGLNIKGIEKIQAPVIYLAENQEQTPLGRAEWIKLLGILTGKQKEADSIFNNVVKRYTQINRELAACNGKRPKVLTELMYQGVWYVPKGGSYQAAILKDAGAEYPWADTEGTGSLNLSFEEVLQSAADADFWLLRCFNGPASKSALLALDDRYRHFGKAKIYMCDTSKTDIFSATSFHPERLLEEYNNLFFSKGKLKYFHLLN